MRAKPVGSLILILSLTASTLLARAREEVVRPFDQTVPMPAGGSLRLTHQLGNVTVRAEATPDVRIHAAIHAWAGSRAESEALAAQIRIDVVKEAAGIAIRTIYPVRRPSRNDVSYSVDYEIVMPASAPLFVRNDFGTVVVSGTKAPADVANGHGALRVSNATGDVRLENKFGSIEAEGIAGPLTLTNTNGSVTVTSVDGPLVINNRFGEVVVVQARKGARILNGNGKVTVREATGPVSVTDAFGSVIVATVNGDLSVSNRNGAVEVSNVTGAADITNSFGAVTVSEVGGRLGVTNANARVSVSAIKGSARVQNGYGEIVVRDVGGDLDLQNANAAVSVDNVGGSADVRNSFGRIELRRVGRTANVTGGNGDVLIMDAGGPVYVKNSFGLVQADRVGPLRVENANGAIRAASIRGAADLRTSFAAISLTGVDGDVTIRGQNGAVEVSRLVAKGPKGCHRIDVSTTFAPIRLALPADVGFDVAAKTSFGRIETEIPITTTGAVGADSLVGTIRGGGCPVTVSNSNGSIALAAAAPKP